MKVLLFDFDGLLVDTETANARAWQEVFAAHGVTLALSEWAAHWATERSHRLSTLDLLCLRSTGTVDRDRVASLRRSRYQQFAADLPLRAGVDAWLARAVEDGHRIAVVSNGRGDRIRAELHRLGIAGAVERIVTPDNRRERKPAPDLYHRVLRELHVTPDRTVAFEDSPAGVLAASRAGIPCVAVPTVVSSYLSFPAAHLVVPDPSAVTLDAVLDTLDGVTAPITPLEYRR
jgi:HAD superfamily hydrolase (TIGR01509 family)